MVIKHLSSSVDLDRAQSEHVMVVGLLEAEGGVEVPIDAVTYGHLVGAFEQLHLQAQAEVYGTQQPYADARSVPTAETVRQEVEQHLGHQLAPGPAPSEEVEAEAQLRALEQASRGSDPSDPDALLRSVGFLQEDADGLADDTLAATGTEDDEPDRGEGLFPVVDDDDDDGVAAF